MSSLGFTRDMHSFVRFIRYLINCTFNNIQNLMVGSKISNMTLFSHILGDKIFLYFTSFLQHFKTHIKNLIWIYFFQDIGWGFSPFIQISYIFQFIFIAVKSWWSYSLYSSMKWMIILPIMTALSLNWFWFYEFCWN